MTKPTPKKPLSGAQRRKLRVAQGLPRYTPGEERSRKARDKQRNRERQANYMARVAEIKTTLGCADCGYDAHPAALHFDHLPQYEKRQIIAKMWNRRWQAVLDEMAKCEVVCANCHAIRTVERRDAESELSGQGVLPLQAPGVTR